MACPGGEAPVASEAPGPAYAETPAVGVGAKRPSAVHHSKFSHVLKTLEFLEVSCPRGFCGEYTTVGIRWGTLHGYLPDIPQGFRKAWYSTKIAKAKHNNQPA